MGFPKRGKWLHVRSARCGNVRHARTAFEKGRRRILGLACSIATGAQRNHGRIARGIRERCTWSASKSATREGERLRKLRREETWGLREISKVVRAQLFKAVSQALQEQRCFKEAGDIVLTLFLNFLAIGPSRSSERLDLSTVAMAQEASQSDHPNAHYDGVAPPLDLGPEQTGTSAAQNINHASSNDHSTPDDSTPEEVADNESPLADAGRSRPEQAARRKSSFLGTLNPEGARC